MKKERMYKYLYIYITGNRSNKEMKVETWQVNKINDGLTKLRE